MIAYQMVGASDLDKSKAFYDPIMQKLGAADGRPTPKGIMYSFSAGPGFAITRPFNDEPVTHGNGSMTAFACSSPEQVVELHSLALSMGGTDEGAPGDRSGFGTFAYFRDPDGNKLCLACFNQ